MCRCTSARKLWLSRPIAVTSPILTPAILTGAPTLRSPMLSNSAVTSYPGVLPKPSLSPLEGSWVVRKTSAARPRITKSPVPISRERVARMAVAILLQESGGQHVVEQQREHGRGDDGPGRREPDPLSRRLRLIALVDGDEADDGSEDDALDDPFGHVTHCNGALRLRPEGPAVDAEKSYADELRAVQADDVEDRDEQRHGDEAAEEAWSGDIAQRVDRHHLHRGELIRGLHEANLGSQRRAGAAGEEERSQHGAELLQQRQRGDLAERCFRPEALQNILPQEPQHHSGEQTRQHDDDERAGAGIEDLRDDEPRPRERRHTGEQQPAEEYACDPELAHPFQKRAVSDPSAHPSPAPRSWAA